MNKSSSYCSFAIVLLLSCLTPLRTEGKPIDPSVLYGKWEKEFFIQKETKNADPRWALTIRFEKSGAFFYSSESVQEARRTNGRTEPVTTQVNLEGKWEVNGKGNLVVTFNRTLNEGELTDVAVNLRFDPKRKEAVIACRLEGALLDISGLGAERHIFLRKVVG